MTIGSLGNIRCTPENRYTERMIKNGELFPLNAGRSLPTRHRCSSIPSQHRSFHILFVYSTSDVLLMK